MQQDDHLVKRAYKKVKYNTKQIEELKACMDQVTGPEYFMRNFMYIQHPTEGNTKFVPYPYQVELIRVYSQYRKSVCMLSRQTGKTTVAAGYLLWYAMYNDDSTILITSNKFDSAQEIMTRVRYAYEMIPDHIRAGVKSYNKKTIDFDNGSRIISTTTTENTGRGMSLSLVYCDETSSVPPGIASAFWTSLSPALSTGGKCIMTSTPNTDEDQFAKIWFGATDVCDKDGNEMDIGANGFKAFKAIWSDHPCRNQEWADAELASIGEELFRREHMCEFISFEETLISSIKLSTIKGKDPIKRTGQVRWYEPISPNLTYVIGLDPSLGTGGDNAAIQVFSLPDLRQVAEWSDNRTPIEGQLRVLKQIGQEITTGGGGEIYWSVESNTIGEAALVVIRDSGEESFPGTMLHDHKNRPTGRSKRGGFLTTSKSKLEACSKLKHLVETNKMTINSRLLISELKTFISKATSFEAKIGKHDDLVSATLLFIRMADLISLWDERSQRTLSSNIVDESDDAFGHPLPIII